MGSTELNELMKGDSLEGSAHTPMYNTHILPLTMKTNQKIQFQL